MHALAQSVEVLVVALAVAAFAHFGVTVKDPPHPRAAPVVHRISASTASIAALGRRASRCPFARDMRKV